ncbi:hypothetical protein SY88_03325 [Clostridiales bacterium PH28_bin88]|nr:hypothetical protein SY88_03325 [Clostridiales bacterium PH28_bin88]
MIASQKVQRYVDELKKGLVSTEEVKELLDALAKAFSLRITVSDDEGDSFWDFSQEEEARFNDLLTRAVNNSKNGRYTEYRKPLA